MCEARPSRIPHLKQRNLQRFEAIAHDLLQHPMASVPGRTQECSGGDGGQVKSVVFK
jgi:hypothetical protein